MRGRFVCVFLVLAVLSSSAAADNSPWREKLRSWRNKRETSGNFGSFNRERLLRNIRSGRVTLLGRDPAAEHQDRRSSFFVIRSRSAFKRRPDIAGEHVLGVMAPTEGDQPVHLSDMSWRQASDLGRMIRTVLTSIERIHPPGERGGQYRQWVADIHLPDSITMPVLHVHGEFEDGLLKNFGQPKQPRLSDWSEALGRRRYRRSKRPGYDVHIARSHRWNNWDVVGVTASSITMKRFLKGSAQLDRVVGEMVLDVAARALNRGTTRGCLVVERDQRQVVAKVVEDPRAYLYVKDDRR